MSRPVFKIMFIGAEDWLFASRHLPAIRAALELGLEPIVVARSNGHGPRIERAGARFVAMPRGPSGNSPVGLWRQIANLRALLVVEKPLILQMHGIRQVMLGTLAARMAGADKRVCAFNGLGWLSAATGFPGDAARAVARALANGPIGGPSTTFLFDNPDDPAVLGLTRLAEGEQPHSMLPRSNVRVVGGLGVDPLIHAPEPMPWSPPLKLVFGSPLLWSNGPDIAVEAVGKAREAGIDVTLSLIGAALAPSRLAVPPATLTGWSRLPGISWFGPTADVSQIWRQHHVLILPSRGGDGIPAIVTEAAAAERPIITTDMAGCRSFVRAGIDGQVVPAGNVGALVDALAQLSRAPGLVERMGRAARERALNGYTERDVMDGLKRLWREMLGLSLPT